MHQKSGWSAEQLMESMADSHRTIKAVGFARAIEQGLLGDSDVERLVAAGSPQFRRRQAVRMLDRVPYLRAQLGLDEAGAVSMEIERPAGGGRKTIRVPVAPQTSPP